MSDEKYTGPGRESPLDIPSRSLLVLSLMSAAVYLLLSLLIFYYVRESGFSQAFDHGYSVATQLLTGIIAGSIGAGIIGFITSRKPISKALHDFYIFEMISKARFSTFDRIQLSLFAGAGEELLFRGAIQPLLGIGLTSVIFVGLHGYFKFKSIGHVVFGGLVFGLSVGLGYLYEFAGLFAAMSAHAVYDIIMLHWVQGRLWNTEYTSHQ